MKRPKTLFLIVLVSIVALVMTMRATPQQQQSGGQAVSVTNFPATQPVSGTFWQATQPVSGTFWQATQPVSFSQPALVAGTAKIGTTYPYTSCGTTAFTKALQAMPTSSTAIAVATTCVLGIEISNTSGGALTVTISDNAGTPVNFLNGVTINAGETRTYNWANGRQFTSGVKVQASGAGITYSLEGLQ